MQAVRMKGLPACSRRRAKARMIGLQRRAVSAAMYSALRTEMRPHQMDHFPRSFPLSRLYGASPTRAEISRRLSRPSSGSSATSVALLAGPTSGTDLSRSA
jgi:hypothetical protein